MGFCGKCGSALEVGSEFCGNCGRPTIRPSTSQASQSFYNTDVSNFFASQSTPTYPSDSGGVECLKCGSTSSLTVFHHSERISSTFFEGKNTTRTTTKRINIPLCYECNSELTEWKNSHSNERNSMTDTVCLNLCGLIILFFAGMYYSWVAIIMIIVFILEAVYIAYRRGIKHQPISPFRYVKFSGSRTYVKPKGMGRWIKYQTWLESSSPYY